jgi:hypothetical protein
MIGVGLRGPSTEVEAVGQESRYARAPMQGRDVGRGTDQSAAMSRADCLSAGKPTAPLRRCLSGSNGIDRLKGGGNGAHGDDALRPGDGDGPPRRFEGASVVEVVLTT